MLRRSSPRPERGRVRATSDCEHCRPGLVSQPANTVSSLAYVVAGADLLRRRAPDRPYAWALIAVGVGSVAYHGPGGAAGKWAHDASLLALLGLMAASDATVAEGRPMTPVVVGGVTTAAAVAAHPRTTDAAQLATGALALVAAGRRYARSSDLRDLKLTLPLWTAGIACQLLGRTGERWCRPDSLLQPHAAWHVLSAGALWSRRHL